MLIMPAIDLRDGMCVRLSQGRFDDVTTYGDPFVQLRAFADAGATWVHIVDLDGAKAREPVQHELIGELARASTVQIQCGGGVRAEKHIAALLKAGVARVVIGSAAANNPLMTRNWLTEFSAESICCAFDVRPDGDAWSVATSGWLESGGVTLEDALSPFPPDSLRHVLITDIARDGVMSGPNLDLMISVRAARPDLQIQASGGVASLADLAALRETGVAAAIVGRALYERRFSLEAALAS